MISCEIGIAAYAKQEDGVYLTAIQRLPLNGMVQRDNRYAQLLRVFALPVGNGHALSEAGLSFRLPGIYILYKSFDIVNILIFIQKSRHFMQCLILILRIDSDSNNILI